MPTVEGLASALMTVKLIIAGVLLLSVSGLGFASFLNQSAMVEAVNARLPAAEQFDPFWWGPAKTLRLRSEYRRFYPDGRLLRRQRVLTTLMFFCLLLAVFLLWQVGV